MKEILSWIDSNIMWGPAMIAFLLGSHVFLTIKTGFIQKYIGKGIKLSLQKDKSKKGELSVFGSLMTALSSTIGTGNIIGVGTAIIAGGPGAVFWTWIGGFLALRQNMLNHILRLSIVLYIVMVNIQVVPWLYLKN